MVPINTVDDALYYASSLLASALLYVVLKNRFGETFKIDDPASPTSFFPLHQVMQSGRLRLLRSFAIVPLVALFFAVCVFSQTFVQAFYQSYSGKAANEANAVLASSIPVWLYPIAIVVMAFFFLLPILRKPISLYFDAVIGASDIRRRADVIAKQSAQGVLLTCGHKDFMKRMKATYNQDVPLDPKLTEKSVDLKTAYQLVYFASPNTPSDGLASSIDNILERLDAKPNPAISAVVDPAVDAADGAGGFPIAPVVGAVAFYLVLCFIYTVGMPLLQPFVTGEKSAIRELLQPIEWPKAVALDALARSVLHRSLSFVFPLALGLFAIRTQIANQANKSGGFRTLFLGTLLTVFAVSFVMNIVFELVEVARLVTGDNEAYPGVTGLFPIILGESKLWIEFVISATAPVLALAATYLCARGGVKKAFVYGVVIAISASVFMLSRYVYEQQSAVRGYYWHELVLGAFLIVSYYLAASVSRGVFSSTLNEFFAAPRNTAQPVPAGG